MTILNLMLYHMDSSKTESIFDDTESDLLQNSSDIEEIFEDLKLILESKLILN